MSDQPIKVEYDALASLSSLLSARGEELRVSGSALRGVPELANAHVSAGQLAVERLWGQALTLLDESLELTATKVGDSITLYQQGDRTVAAAMSSGTPGPVAGYPMQAAV